MESSVSTPEQHSVYLILSNKQEGDLTRWNPPLQHCQWHPFRWPHGHRCNGKLNEFWFWAAVRHQMWLTLTVFTVAVIWIRRGCPDFGPLLGSESDALASQNITGCFCSASRRLSPITGLGSLLTSISIKLDFLCIKTTPATKQYYIKKQIEPHFQIWGVSDILKSWKQHTRSSAHNKTTASDWTHSKSFKVFFENYGLFSM